MSLPSVSSAKRSGIRCPGATSASKRTGRRASAESPSVARSASASKVLGEA
jgi:hypothetical protein